MRKDGVKQMILDKTPLKDRINKAKSIDSTYLNIYDIYLFDYFETLSKISDTPNLMEFYFDNLQHLDKKSFTTLAGAPQALDELSDTSSGNLYKILIHPFTQLKTEKEIDNEPTNKNTTNF